jgi:hypothetical protein
MGLLNSSSSVGILPIIDKTVNGLTNYLAGRPVCQYGLLWEACQHSFPYMCNQLAQISCTVEVPAANLDWVPLSIPLIIKQLAGNTLTYAYICIQGDLLTLTRLEQISIALDYNICLI